MNIVIVDDQEINLKVLSNLIEKSVGFKSENFQDPQAALIWCTTKTPDLIFVDYMMPVMDGLEFIRKFRELPDHNDAPVVMITAADDKQVRVKALELGASDFLQKPFDKAEFIARTKNMLAIRRHQKELISRSEWLSQEIHKATEEILKTEREVIFRLSRAAEYRSPETGMHVMRVAAYCRELAKQIHMDEDDQETIFVAASMHDIGKVATPDKILYKAGKLDQYEFAMIKLHTLTGFEIMHNSTSKMMQIAAQIALAHHEKFDGTGYPKGLKGEAIPLAARICTIADVFDALTSERPYKPAWETDTAFAELERLSGKHFDPHLVENFKVILPEICKIKNRYSERQASVA